MAVAPVSAKRYYGRAPRVVPDKNTGEWWLLSAHDIADDAADGARLGGLCITLPGQIRVVPLISACMNKSVPAPSGVPVRFPPVSPRAAWHCGEREPEHHRPGRRAALSGG